MKLLTKYIYIILKMKIKTLSEIVVSSQFSNEICNAKCLEAILQESNVTETEIEPECILKLKKVISNLCLQVNKKWKESYRNKYTYESRNTTWLDKDVKYELIKRKTLPKRKLSYEGDTALASSSSNPGRPIGSTTKEFCELGRIQQWRKSTKLASEHDPQELISATVKKLKKTDSDLPYILKMSPSKWKKFREGEFLYFLLFFIYN